LGTTLKMRAALGAVLVLLALAGALYWLNGRSLTTARGWVEHTQEVEREIEALATALGEIESGMRGYALTGDGAQMQPALRAEENLASHLTRLQALAQDNPEQAARLASITDLVRQKLAFTHDVVAARGTAGLDAARALVLSGRGLSLMDAIRASLGSLRREERWLLQQRTATAEALRRRNARLFGLLGGLLALSLLGFLWLLRAEVRARSAAQELIRNSEQRFRLMLSVMKDYAIVLLSPDGRVETWNAAAERMYGYGEHEALGRDLAIFYPPDEVEAGRPRRELQAAELRGWSEQEGRRARKGGAIFWADAVLSAMRDDRGELRGFAEIVRDVTERRAIDEQLRTFAAQLEASNRELQDFAMVASHDLQEPLRKIQVFGDKLQRRSGSALDPTGRDYLSRMQRAASRGQALIQGLLAFSRLTMRAMPPAPLDLNSTAEEVLGDLEARLSEVGGRVELSPLPTIEADPLQMRQLLQNLIGNALKFRKQGETPVVRVYAEPVPRQAGEEAERVRVVVEDNGIGFEPRFTDRLFKLFQRLHDRSEYEGSGMGLAICRKIAERHGGRIDARSAPGEGSAFVVELPVRQRPLAPLPAPVERESRPPSTVH
jgi:PAS domain S-box-containing protein